MPSDAGSPLPSAGALDAGVAVSEAAASGLDDSGAAEQLVRIASETPRIARRIWFTVEGTSATIYPGTDEHGETWHAATIARMSDVDCTLCRAADGDAELDRVQVWEDGLWRLSMSVRGYTTGFGYLEPKRHIPHVTDLDGEEAATFGPVLGRVTAALREAAGAELVYVYIFGGGIPHLHVHLAPHRDGDALNSAIIRGEVENEELPSGAGRIRSLEFPEVAPLEIQSVIDRARELLA